MYKIITKQLPRFTLQNAMQHGSMPASTMHNCTMELHAYPASYMPLAPNSFNYNLFGTIFFCSFGKKPVIFAVDVFYLVTGQAATQLK